jgi:hypothetical protein
MTQRHAVTQANLLRPSAPSGGWTGPCLLRLDRDDAGTLRPTSVTVCLPGGEPLWTDSHLIVEMPGWPLVRCVVAQQLSRVNRYRLRVLDEVHGDAVLPVAP